MKGIGAGLGGHDGGSIAGTGILRAVVGSQYLNLLDGVDAGVHDERAVILVDSNIQSLGTIDRES